MLAARCRAAALRLLAPASGDRILVVGPCPTAHLRQLARAVTPGGQVMAVDLGGRRHTRAARAGDRHLQLPAGGARDAVIDGLADAAYFHLAPHLHAEPRAALNVLRQLRPGATVVALVRTRRDLVFGDPWVLLARYVADFQTMPVGLGRCYVGHGTIAPHATQRRRPAGETIPASPTERRN